MGNEQQPVSSAEPARSDLDAAVSQILAVETRMAKLLALHVIDKPLPRVWMIFIPILFVLYFWKLKEYETALKEFSTHYLSPRQRTLEAAAAAVETGTAVDIPRLAALIGSENDETAALYDRWLTLLADHYRLLLSARGEGYDDLVRSAYRDSSGYLSFCRRLGETEARLNQALTETIEGDSAELQRATSAMAEGVSVLLTQESERIFAVSCPPV